MKCCTFRGWQYTDVLELCIDFCSWKIWKYIFVLVGNKKFFITSASTLQFKMVCKRKVKFMEELVVWWFLKCLAFFLGFCKTCLHRQLRKNKKEFTRSLLTRSNALCRIAFCFRKNNLCVNICFPYARTLVYYHPSPPFCSDRFSLSLM